MGTEFQLEDEHFLEMVGGDGFHGVNVLNATECRPKIFHSNQF